MVNRMKLLNLKTELGRALRNFKYERTQSGLFFPASGVCVGGVFTARVDDGPANIANNTVTLECLDDMLTVYLGNGGQTNAFYIAPFINNVAPSSALTGATFAATQGEYVGYTAATRLAWTPDGPSVGQTMGNTAAPAMFVIGAAAATVSGAGLLTTSTKGATTGKLVAAALFATPNALNPASKLSIEYSLSATAA